jgi:hypothetical protein
MSVPEASRPLILGLQLDDDVLDQLVGLVAERLAEREAKENGTPWRNATEAAEHIRAKLSRIRKLTMTGDLKAYHDGSRVLYHVDDLDDFVRRGGARSP